MNNEKRSLEDLTKEMLLDIGVPIHIKGYQYLAEAITIAAGAEEVLTVKVQDLYAQVAKLFQTTSSRVEIAISHAVEIAWDRGDTEFLQRFFGYGDNSKLRPTNSEFIILLADKVQLKKRCEEAED